MSAVSVKVSEPVVCRESSFLSYRRSLRSIDETLEKMGLDYLVMMIIHSPQPWVEVNQSENRYVEGNRVAWKALEDEYEAGKLKVIGGAVASTIFNR